MNVSRQNRFVITTAQTPWEVTDVVVMTDFN